MGQQIYEERVAERAEALLGERWAVRRIVLRSLRSQCQGTHRLPSRLMANSSEQVRAAAGRFLYRGSDVVHRLDLRIPPFRGPEILTIHDAVSWRFPDEATPPSSSVKEARRAATIICPSQFSAAEIADVLGVTKTVVIPNGVSEDFFDADPLSDKELGLVGLSPPFVMHIGGCSLRKNLKTLAAAWQDVRSAQPLATLLLVGPDHSERTRLFSGVPGTRLLGRVTADIVPRLMASAAAVVVPSTYEGFGLPALEAMAAGTPVVAANRSSLPEVCGDAAILVEPDRAGIAEGIIAALEGGSAMRLMASRGRSRAQDFTWDRSAAAHAEVWRSYAGDETVK